MSRGHPASAMTTTTTVRPTAARFNDIKTNPSPSVDMNQITEGQNTKGVASGWIHIPQMTIVYIFSFFKKNVFLFFSFKELGDVVMACYWKVGKCIENVWRRNSQDPLNWGWKYVSQTKILAIRPWNLRERFTYIPHELDRTGTLWNPQYNIIRD